MGKEKTLSTINRNAIIKMLHQQYYNTLKPFAMVLTQNENEADELVSLTFTKICFWSDKRLNKIILWDAPSIFSYLATTVSNTHKDNYRKKNRQKLLLQNYSKDFGQGFEDSPEAAYVAKENIKIIRHAYHEVLSQSDKVLRVAFYLRTERGWKNKEIAERFDQSANTVGTNFRRIRIKIKEKIAN